MNTDLPFIKDWDYTPTQEELTLTLEKALLSAFIEQEKSMGNEIITKERKDALEAVVESAKSLTEACDYYISRDGDLWCVVDEQEVLKEALDKLNNLEDGV